MPRVRAGELSINYVEHGSGDNVVLAVHGNLGCADWLGLVLPLLPADLRVIAAEWRGCGDSDKPEPASDYSNYSMATHAQDMLALLDALDIRKCHLFGHSTGGIICSYMMVKQPARFGKALMLDPVTPLGLELADGQIDLLKQMKSDPDVCFAGMASAAPTLFRPDTLGRQPQYADTTSTSQREVFARIIERTRVLSDGIWFGTPRQLAQEWHSKTLAAQMPAMRHEHLLLCGKLDYWVPREHFEEMARRLPRASLELFPFIGHSMNLEAPTLFARIFADYYLKAG
jgi:pimeloyl-ACP methyl ester carboxylesterase